MSMMGPSDGGLFFGACGMLCGNDDISDSDKGYVVVIKNNDIAFCFVRGIFWGIYLERVIPLVV